MTGLFKGPNVTQTTPEAAPPAPTVDDARARIDDTERQRLRRGRAANDVVQEETEVSTAAKRLTGN